MNIPTITLWKKDDKGNEHCIIVNAHEKGKFIETGFYEKTDETDETDEPKKPGRPKKVE